MGFEDTGYCFGTGGGNPDGICKELTEFGVRIVVVGTEPLLVDTSEC